MPYLPTRSSVPWLLTIHQTPWKAPGGCRRDGHGRPASGSDAGPANRDLAGRGMTRADAFEPSGRPLGTGVCPHPSVSATEAATLVSSEAGRPGEPGDDG